MGPRLVLRKSVAHASSALSSVKEISSGPARLFARDSRLIILALPPQKNDCNYYDHDQRSDADADFHRHAHSLRWWFWGGCRRRGGRQAGRRSHFRLHVEQALG